MIVENDPLMEEAEEIDGELWLTGNRTLISLNLASKHHLMSSILLELNELN